MAQALTENGNRIHLIKSSLNSLNYQQILLIGFISIGLLVLLYPLFLVYQHEIWLPSACCHETFGVHLTTSRILRHSYYFLPNAHSYTLIYSHLPALLADFVFASYSEYSKFQIYSVAVQLVNVFLLSGILFFITYNKHLNVYQKGLLLIQIVLPACINCEWVSIFNFNYYQLEVILYLVASYLILRSIQQPGFIRNKHIVFTGAMSAVAVGCKLTYLPTIVPFFLILCLYNTSNKRLLAKSLLIFSISFILAFSLLLTSYLNFHVNWFPAFCRDMINTLLHNKDYMNQNIPYLTHYFTNWFSIKLPFQVLTIFTFIAVGVLSIYYSISRNPRLLLVLIATLLVGVFYVWFLVHRTAPNTFLDIEIYMIFTSTTILAITFSPILRAQIKYRVYATLPLITLLLLVAYSIYRMCYMYNVYLPAHVQFIKDSSSLSKSINNVFQEQPELPIVYYIDRWDTLALYPTVHMWTKYCGDQAQLEELHGKVFQSKVYFQRAVDGIYPGAHIMFIPEYNAENTKDKESLMRNHQVFDKYQQFANVRMDPTNSVWTYVYRGYDPLKTPPVAFKKELSIITVP